MAACLILGDSLAVGLGQNRPDCQTVAVTGVTSTRYVQTLLAARAAESAVISLGVNDGDDADTLGNLRRVRQAVTARRVFWLLPGIKPRVRAIIRQVAVEFDDYLVDTKFEAGPDSLHPGRDGYKFLAQHVP